MQFRQAQPHLRAATSGVLHEYPLSGRYAHSLLVSIEETLRRCVLPLYANTHTEDSATGASTTRLMHEASAYVKRCLGGDEQYAICFPGTGATGALKRLQEILGLTVPEQHRERILSTLPDEERLI